MKKLSQNNQAVLYFVFRVFVGFAFLLHGGQKLFGWFGGLGGGGAVELASLFGLAGIIEFFGGLFILVGLFTSIVALIAALEMAAAYFRVHVSNGIIPLTNSGEPAWLLFASFLVLLAYGAGKWSLEKALLKKEFWHSTK